MNVKSDEETKSSQQRLIDVVNGIPPAQSFAESDKHKLYPHSTVIHRRVIVGANNIQNFKNDLAIARSRAEFSRRVHSNDIYVSMRTNSCGKRQGMSCSTSCYFTDHVRNGSIPLEFLPNSCYEVNNTLGTVIIQGEEYSQVRCFHRTVTPSSQISASGEQADCRLDANFVCYFENTDHGLIRLRDETLQNNDNFTFSANKQQVVFHHPFFDLDSWQLCQTVFVKVPYAVMLAAQSGKSLQDEINKMENQDHKCALESLITAFKLDYLDNLEEINIAIEALLNSSSLDGVSVETRKSIVNILDEFSSDIWGDDSVFYIDQLRPALLKETIM